MINEQHPTFSVANKFAATSYLLLIDVTLSTQFQSCHLSTRKSGSQNLFTNMVSCKKYSTQYSLEFLSLNFFYEKK